MRNNFHSTPRSDSKMEENIPQDDQRSENSTSSAITLYTQRLASVGLQFVLSCLVGGLGSLYSMRALRKVSSSYKVLHKYIAIPNLLVLSLLVCGLLNPLRMFASMIRLAGEDILVFCLAIFYVEQVCEMAAYISMVVVALQRLKGILHIVFNRLLETHIKSCRSTILFAWVIPMMIASWNVYFCATTSAPPWLLAACTHHFQGAGHSLDTAARAMDLMCPLLIATTLIILATAYTIIIKQMRIRTRLIHPIKTSVTPLSSVPDVRHSANESRSVPLGKFGKTVSWSSAASVPCFSDILKSVESRELPFKSTPSDPLQQQQHPSISDYTMDEAPSPERTQSLQVSPDRLNKSSSDSGKGSSIIPASPKQTNKLPDRSSLEQKRRSSIFDLGKVSTIPELRSEEEDATLGGLNLSQRFDSALRRKSSLVNVPCRRRHLPPVKIPDRQRSIKKRKRKKWTAQRKRDQWTAGEPAGGSITSQDSFRSASSGCSIKGSSKQPTRRNLHRQNAVQDAVPPKNVENINEDEQVRPKIQRALGHDISDENPYDLQRYKIPVSPSRASSRMSQLNREESLEEIDIHSLRERKAWSLPSRQLSSFEDGDGGLQLKSIEGSDSHSVNSSSYNNNSLENTSRKEPKRPHSWDITNTQQNSQTIQVSKAHKPLDGSCIITPVDDSPSPSVLYMAKGRTFRRSDSFKEGSSHAPQIRIIRPSTDTIKHCLPGKRGPLLGRPYTARVPMTTIVSTSESEYDNMAASRYNSEVFAESGRVSSVASQDSHQGSSYSQHSVSRWAQRRLTFRRQSSLFRISNTIINRQFSLASIWSNIPRMTTGGGVKDEEVQELSASFVLKRSGLIVGTFLLFNLPLCLLHLCMYSLPPDIVVNIYPLFKLCQQVNFALCPYIYVFSNQKINREIQKSENVA